LEFIHGCSLIANEKHLTTYAKIEILLAETLL